MARMRVVLVFVSFQFSIFNFQLPDVPQKIICVFEE
jgi:hypothetical protein